MTDLDRTPYAMNRITGFVERMCAARPPRPRLIGGRAPPFMPLRSAINSPLVAAIRQPEPGP